MNWKYHAVTLIVFVAAIYATYVLAPVAGGIFLGVGILLEGLFWTRVFKRSRLKRT